MKKVLFIVTVILLVIAFGASAIMVGNYIADSKRNQQIYEDLAQTAATAATEAPATTVPPTTAEETTVPETTEATVATEATEPQILPELQTYYDANNHTVGFLKIPGTRVNYPVVQVPGDRDYYLKRDFYGNGNSAGTLYAELCDINKPSDNVTIYGHNMRDGSMFHDLVLYEDKAYWEENQYIFFNTLYEYHTYRIFAVFKTSANLNEGFAYHKFIDAASAEEFDEFVKECKELGSKYYYDTGITPVYGDKLLCLSTCEYTLDNGRFVVMAVRWDGV